VQDARRRERQLDSNGFPIQRFTFLRLTPHLVLHGFSISLVAPSMACWGVASPTRCRLARRCGWLGSGGILRSSGTRSGAGAVALRGKFGSILVKQTKAGPTFRNRHRTLRPAPGCRGAGDGHVRGGFNHYDGDVRAGLGILKHWAIRGCFVVTLAFAFGFYPTALADSFPDGRHVSAETRGLQPFGACAAVAVDAALRARLCRTSSFRTVPVAEQPIPPR